MKPFKKSDYLKLRRNWRLKSRACDGTSNLSVRTRNVLRIIGLVTMCCFWRGVAVDEQADEPEKKANVDDFFVTWRENLNEELRLLAERSKRDKQNRRTLGELEDSLKEALSALSDEYREDAVPELEDLMKAMTMADFKTKTKLQIFCILIENRCQPGVIREIANVCLDMAEGKQVHLMETPEMIIKFAYRDMQNSEGSLSVSQNHKT